LSSSAGTTVATLAARGAGTTVAADTPIAAGTARGAGPACTARTARAAGGVRIAWVTVGGRFAATPARAAGLSVRGARLAGSAGSGLSTKEDVRAVAATTGRRHRRFRARVDAGRTGGALPTRTAGTTVADQQPALTAVPAVARDAVVRVCRHPRAARAAVAEQPRAAAVPTSAAVDPCHPGAACATGTEQQPAATAVLTGKPIEAIADQQPGIRIVRSPIADEDPNERTDRIRTRRGSRHGESRRESRWSRR
jgi:hypothetical protein